MDGAQQHLIAVGHISGTHGIKGQVRLHSYSGNIASLQSAVQVLLRSKSGRSRQVRLTRVSSHGNKILLTLEGFTSIDEAQELIGHELLLHRDQLPATADGEYYWHDLMGLTVLTTDGRALGTLTEILETGANDVYLVRNQETGREHLIPAIASVINSVDLQSRTMLITPLEGLLDL